MIVSHQAEKVADHLKRSIQDDHDRIDSFIQASAKPLSVAKLLLAHMRELYSTANNAKFWQDTWPIAPTILDQVLEQSENPELDFALYYLINGSQMGLCLLEKRSDPQKTYQVWQQVRHGLDQKFKQRSLSLPLISQHARDIMRQLKIFLTTMETSK